MRFWLFETAIDGGMIRSFVRRQRNRTVSVGVLAPKPAPGKRLVKLSFFETPDGRTTGCFQVHKHRWGRVLRLGGR